MIYTFYHYTKCESVLSILSSQKIWFRMIDSFNDPFEFSFYSDSDLARKIENDLKENCAIFCLSEISDNILMHSHYSDKHRGVVIEFKFNPNDVSNNTNIHVQILGENDNDDGGYSDSLFNADDFMDRRKDRYFNGDDSYKEEFYQKIARNIVNTKSKKDWNYEKEVRFTLIGEKPEPNNDYIPKSLKESGLTISSIYFGCKTLQSDENKIKNIAEQQNIKISKFFRDEKEFKLVKLDV